MLQLNVKPNPGDLGTDSPVSIASQAKPFLYSIIVSKGHRLPQHSPMTFLGLLSTPQIENHAGTWHSTNTFLYNDEEPSLRKRSNQCICISK